MNDSLTNCSLEQLNSSEHILTKVMTITSIVLSIHTDMNLTPSPVRKQTTNQITVMSHAFNQ